MRAVDTEGLDEQIRCEMCRNPMRTDRGCDGNCQYDEKLYERIIQILDERIKPLPSVQPYTDEQIQRMQDMEQAQLDKAFELGKLDAQEEIIRCKECRWRKDQSGSTAWLPCRALATPDDFYCERAERGTDETD